MEQDDKQFLRALRARLAAKVALLDQLLLADTGTLNLGMGQILGSVGTAQSGQNATTNIPAPES